MNTLTPQKIKIALLFFSFVFLGAVVLNFSSSNEYGEMDILYKNNHVEESKIIFSRRSGFYEQEFMLEINAPTQEIYYTLDGSDPDKTSLKYNQPILISDASKNENVYSSRTDTSAAFLIEYIEKVGGVTIDASVPNKLVDKCTVVRAVYYDQYGNRSDIVTGSYFVGFQSKDAYNNITVVSIVTDPENLFDYNTGIYVLGKTFDEFVANNGLRSSYNSLAKYFQWWEANYRNKGSNWERRATLQVFNRSKNIALTQDVGIRIQGGGSRGYPSKSLNVYAREEYDGNTCIHYDFWGTGYLPDEFTIFAGGDDLWSLMRDRLVSDLSREMAFSAMHYEPCMLFLDGEFWGLYYITEKYNETYIMDTYQVNADNVVSVKNTLQEMGSVDCMISFNRWQHFMNNNDMTIPAHYEKACQLMDMESVIDYMAVEAYVGRAGDWLYKMHNTHVWRSIEKGTGEYEDQKWRWMLFDQNSGGISGAELGNNTIAFIRSRSPMVDNLCENEVFAKALAERIVEIGQNQFSSENVNSVMNGYIREMQPAMREHRDRYNLQQDKIDREINDIRFFFSNRFPYVVEMLRNEFPQIDIDAMLRKRQN